MGHYRLSRKLAISPKSPDFNPLAAAVDAITEMAHGIRTTTVRSRSSFCAKSVHPGPRE